MNTYNKIMLNFWLFAAILIFLFISFMCITDNPKKWGVYYIFVVTSLGMYFFKKWMMKRMVKHLEYMEEQRKKNA